MDIYYDATPSVSGYTADGRFIELVTRSLPNAVPSTGEMRLFKLSSVEKGGLTEFDSVTLPGSKDFYATGDTDLGVAVDSLDTLRVSVIVTDLFQSDQDVARLNRALARKLLSTGLTIGLVAAKFNFDGVIYDVGLEKRSFPYKGSRPLYLLVMGRSDPVRGFVHRLGSIGEDYNYLFMEGRVVAHPIAMMAASTKRLDNIVENDCRDSSFRKFVIREPQASNHTVQVVVPIDLLDNTLSLSDGGFSVTRRESWYGNEPFSRDQSPVTAQFEMNASADSANLSIGIEPIAIPERGLYRFDLEIKPRRAGLPDWVSDWSFGEADMSTSDNSRQRFDGSRTQHLNSFVSKLLADVGDLQEPTLGTISLLIENPD